ncbi:putative ubiquitin carboxyl-terminal hydrolase [Phaeomoniella chlamydospora]|uniref:Ubiquitin carboxyl-terminal hydrolase n=1 Tax=Phaeomoniella chlamydospora TaxID=158046 RepID=A0A0G2E3S7_PHACM|nr:putative ubiquitin carboxyl-terminal hydrolase [Phaeomoniella chlamydospora]
MSAETGGWSTIESDAGVFTSLIETLGVKNVQFEELYELDDPAALQNLSPVYGLVFLFKWIGGSSKTDNPQDGSYDRTAIDEENLFFAHQTIQNACGTQALLSVLLNQDESSLPTDTAIDLGPQLSDFKAFTTGFPPDLRGEALSNSDLIRETHNSFAKSSPFVDETVREATVTEDVYHFIAYTHHNGTLYELDGLQPHPISHGPCNGFDDFPGKVIPVIRRRIDRYPVGQIMFNLLAVVRDLRKRAEEMGDFEGLENERRKRAHWEWENTLRRHNFVGFIGEMLKGVVDQKVKTGEYEKWVDEAKAKSKSRYEARSKKGQSMED